MKSKRDSGKGKGWVNYQEALNDRIWRMEGKGNRLRLDVKEQRFTKKASLHVGAASFNFMMINKSYGR